MGQESQIAQKRSGAAGGSLPTTTTTTTRLSGCTSSGIPCGRQIQKTFNNLKITIFCGFVTILVLRDTIGVGNLGGGAEAENQLLIEETNRILAEICSNSDPNYPSDAEPEFNPNVTYTLGPKISDWDEQCKIWLQRLRVPQE